MARHPFTSNPNVMNNLYTYVPPSTSDGSDEAPVDNNEQLYQDLNGIFGIPYQFMDTVDERPDGSNIGSKYASKILGPMNMLMLVPCKQVFMDGFSKRDKGNVLSALLTGDSDLLSTVEKNGRYYTTEFDYNDYYNMVNVLCREVAYFLGIQNKEVTFNGKHMKCGKIDWMDWQSGFEKAAMLKHAVCFYLDGGAEQTESFSNDTTESSLASTLNGFGDQVNEIKFLLGEDSALAKIASKASDVSSSITGALGDLASGLTGNMLSSLAEKGTNTILKGGKIIFPKLWSNSGFSRSYSFDIKLRSPDHDDISIFMNLFVPLMHLLALTLPITMEDDANGYKSPFLVKAYEKGFFNIDMGLVTSLTVTRGGECQWNDAGLPTQINVSLEIEDLYSFLALPNLKTSNPFSELAGVANIVKNTALMDYLSNLSGLNIGESELDRAAKLYMYLMGKEITVGLKSNFWNRIDNGISNLMYKIYHKLGAVQ